MDTPTGGAFSLLHLIIRYPFDVCVEGLSIEFGLFTY